mgnify:CR=1 FL=1
MGKNAEPTNRLIDHPCLVVAPCHAEFDPQFSAEAPVFVEKLFNPFSGKNSFQPSGYAYPSEGGK